ncbi:MAG: hypothetical protein LBM98_01985 [Oscillospiraceae bacterium]|nr:hypothetical protein [Oscillospiraceae bacterium]
MRYAQGFRREAIQCRERNIRICGLRHWIASPLYFLRILQFPRLAKTVRRDGSWTRFRRGLGEVRRG